MKTTYVMIAIFALAAMAVMPVMAADDDDEGTTCTIGGDCQGAAWDTGPLPSGECPNLENITETEEWQQCGTFCEAGQTPPGWPYGWYDDYWLRPDSNF